MLNVNAERNICYECGVLFIGDDVVCPKCKAEMLELVPNPTNLKVKENLLESL